MIGYRQQGTIRGPTSPFCLIASVDGPLFGAFVYDEVGNRDAAFGIFAGHSAVSAAML